MDVFNHLLFFAAYVICKKIHSVGLFFRQTKIANSFYSKINDSSRVRTKGSQVKGSGFESLTCQKILRFIPNIFRYPKLVKYYGVPLGKFLELRQKILTENLDTAPPPLLSINFSATGNFLKHSTEGFPYEVFRYCETNFDEKSSPPPPLIIHKIYRYQKFYETQGSPSKFFGTLR